MDSLSRNLSKVYFGEFTSSFSLLAGFAIFFSFALFNFHVKFIPFFAMYFLFIFADIWSVVFSLYLLLIFCISSSLRIRLNRIGVLLGWIYLIPQVPNFPQFQSRLLSVVGF